MKTSSGVKIRTAELSDCEAITSVHCSGVARWVRHVGDKEVDDTYENLGLLDRYLIGGPWMSLETCVSYVDFLLSRGQHPLVAETNGNIVGEIEVFIGEEPLPLGKNACVSVLEVAKNYRRKGVGRALVSEAIKLAEKEKCHTAITSPEGNAIGFYRKCGLNETLMELKNIEIGLGALSLASDVRVDLHELDSYADLRAMHIVFGRWDSSFAQWLKRQWKFDLRPSSMTVEEGLIPSYEAVYRIESHPLDEFGCNLLAWVKNLSKSMQVLNVCADKAVRLGFKKLKTIVSTELLDTFRGIPISTGKSEIILGKKLATHSP